MFISHSHKCTLKVICILTRIDVFECIFYYKDKCVFVYNIRYHLYRMYMLLGAVFVVSLEDPHYSHTLKGAKPTRLVEFANSSSFCYLFNYRNVTIRRRGDAVSQYSLHMSQYLYEREWLMWRVFLAAVLCHSVPPSLYCISMIMRQWKGGPGMLPSML